MQPMKAMTKSDGFIDVYLKVKKTAQAGCPHTDAPRSTRASRPLPRLPNL
jgi:hypothetical protein